MDNGTNLKFFQSEFRTWYRTTLPYKVSVMAKNDIILNFTKRHGSYTQNGKAFEKWQQFSEQRPTFRVQNQE